MVQDSLARAGARALLALFMLAGGAAPMAAAGQATSTGLDQWTAVLERERDTLTDQIDGDLTTYDVEAELIAATDDAYGRIEGELTIEWVNPSDEPAAEIYLRLYPNDERYRDGGMEVEDLTVDGEPAESELNVSDTLLTVSLDDEIDAGDSATIELEFISVIPNNVISSFGMFNYDTASESYTLDHWFPLLAGYDPANGYELGPLSINGDPVFSNVAFFTVSLTTPEEMVVASTGTIE